MEHSPVANGILLPDETILRGAIGFSQNPQMDGRVPRKISFKSLR